MREYKSDYVDTGVFSDEIDELVKQGRFLGETLINCPVCGRCKYGGYFTHLLEHGWTADEADEEAQFPDFLRDENGMFADPEC